MNKIQQVNRYYAVSKSLMSLYLPLSSVDEDAVKLLELAELFINKAKTLKEEFDGENPEFDAELKELQEELEKNE